MIYFSLLKSVFWEGRSDMHLQTRDPLSREHHLCLSKKLTGDGSQQTVHEPCTNYTNIVLANWFANKMFASVYAA